jgi:tryptophan synthase beta chain
VTGGDQTLRAAIDEALRDWVSDPMETFYLLGSAVRTVPYPYLVRELQAVIGREARAQIFAAARRFARRGVRVCRRWLELHRHVSCVHTRS